MGFHCCTMGKNISLHENEHRRKFKKYSIFMSLSPDKSINTHWIHGDLKGDNIKIPTLPL